MITLELTHSQIQDLYLSTLFAFNHAANVNEMERWNSLSNILFEAMDAYEKKHDD